MWRKNTIQHLVEHKAHRFGIRISRVSAVNTSALAFDGSGTVNRDKNNHSKATFATGKQYNTDLNASYNIGARYFIRETIKTLPETAGSWLEAKVPEVKRRTLSTLSTLLEMHKILKEDIVAA